MPVIAHAALDGGDDAVGQRESELRAGVIFSLTDESSSDIFASAAADSFDNVRISCKIAVSFISISATALFISMLLSLQDKQNYTNGLLQS